ncbi:UNKNOWN [Stylonychia lemnae]|uniref:VWFA domain-containing protein n=1 Tax=Stylonychia lemnae TaxID=5949 RepID=A0A078B6X9_STYLE|nr:UNKNOWN [Stylonychia lemnae]|eukprot:CDW89057.1 UNKNOWN [Stylonychia lemnae]
MIVLASVRYIFIVYLKGAVIIADPVTQKTDVTLYHKYNMALTMGGRMHSCRHLNETIPNLKGLLVHRMWQLNELVIIFGSGLLMHHQMQSIAEIANKAIQQQNGVFMTIAKISENGQVLNLYACHDGYISSSNLKTCSQTCQIGYYGNPQYNLRSGVYYAFCYQCSSSCFECSDLQLCKSCMKGYYLRLNNREQSVGTCLQKSLESYEDTIYVGSVGRLNSRDSSLIDGTINNYFNSIQDAIKKAYELGAPYQSAQITILLLDGSHAMITINYKLRDTFHFLVGAGLTIKNLIFDAIDSSLDLETDINQSIFCAQNPSQQCCYIDSNGNLAGQPSSELCFAAEGTNFINFDMNSQTMITSPPTLVLEPKAFNITLLFAICRIVIIQKIWALQALD